MISPANLELCFISVQPAQTLRARSGAKRGAGGGAENEHECALGCLPLTRAAAASAASTDDGWLDAPEERNLLRFVFLNPAARSFICRWEERARRIAAEFRADSSPHFDEPELHSLIAALRQDSEDFARFWDEQAVLGREGGERTFNHPRDGFLRFEQVTFEVANHADLKMTILIRQPGDHPKGNAKA